MHGPFVGTVCGFYASAVLALALYFAWSLLRWLRSHGSAKEVCWGTGIMVAICAFAAHLASPDALLVVKTNPTWFWGGFTLIAALVIKSCGTNTASPAPAVAAEQTPTERSWRLRSNPLL